MDPSFIAGTSRTNWSTLQPVLLKLANKKLPPFDAIPCLALSLQYTPPTSNNVNTLLNLAFDTVNKNNNNNNNAVALASSTVSSLTVNVEVILNYLNDRVDKYISEHAMIYKVLIEYCVSLLGYDNVSNIIIKIIEKLREEMNSREIEMAASFVKHERNFMEEGKVKKIIEEGEKLERSKATSWEYDSLRE
ncbi:hypothetical protein TL16_g01682 [Triparma laevis f. inornata]|uniref:Uncharacterized protein n=1 Tax=Triparma laevis f. inornata TaxID=1714386 RepID=A0A9W7DTN5_9STRA|nr:hypothetical protein TL16_g01682 [Triparma laevis f. inornata]